MRLVTSYTFPFTYEYYSVRVILIVQKQNPQWHDIGKMSIHQKIFCKTKSPIHISCLFCNCHMRKLWYLQVFVLTPERNYLSLPSKIPEEWQQWWGGGRNKYWFRLWVSKHQRVATRMTFDGIQTFGSTVKKWGFSTYMYVSIWTIVEISTFCQMASL